MDEIEIPFANPEFAQAISLSNLPKSVQPSFGCKSGNYSGISVPASRAVEACASVLKSQAPKNPPANSKVIMTATGYNICVPKPLSNPPSYNPVQIFQCQAQ